MDYTARHRPVLVRARQTHRSAGSEWTAMSRMLLYRIHATARPPFGCLKVCSRVIRNKDRVMGDARTRGKKKNLEKKMGTSASEATEELLLTRAGTAFYSVAFRAAGATVAAVNRHPPLFSY